MKIKITVLLFLFIFIFSFNKPVFSKIFISGDSIEELKASIKQFESLLPEQQKEIIKEVELGLVDRYLKKVGDKFDSVTDTVRANQRFLKLSALAGAFAYGKYINPEFFPKLIKKVSSESAKVAASVVDSVVSGTVDGIWERKGFTAKIVAGLLFYGLITKSFSIGMKFFTGYIFKVGEKKAEFRYAKKKSDWENATGNRL